jgi:hypothetical protein
MEKISPVGSVHYKFMDFVHIKPGNRNSPKLLERRRNDRINFGQRIHHHISHKESLALAITVFKIFNVISKG